VAVRFLFGVKDKIFSHQMKKLIAIIVVSLFLGINLSFSQPHFFKQLADSAITLTQKKVIYDPAYFSIGYPNGDVPADRGVCTDVIIRAYRKMKIDLQKEVHEDMRANFGEYPKLWNLKKTDANIDHRRVPNLMRFFERNGEVKPISKKSNDYLPGDIVCWNLGGAITHIGIVIDKMSYDKKRNLIVHNIGSGQVIQDCLFNFKIIGHYRYKK
jgi:uncharacterized protein YijF (DUF1287 family)